MNTSKARISVMTRLIAMIVLIGFFFPSAATASLEQSFDALQVGTVTYRNVTVTTKNKNYIFILHSTGMTNIKVADLSPELRTKLGYEDPAAKVKTNTPAAWAKQTLSKLDVPEVKNFRAQVTGWLAPNAAKLKWPPAALKPTTLWIAAGLLFALYLFHCFCCMAICNKCGSDPGPLIWVPVFQLFPLLKAASMSSWWFVAFLVPGINLLAQVVWFVKIAQARGKGFGVVLLLIFPLTSPLAMLYLAFSEGKPRKRETSRRVEIMTLEAA
jgi:hypothetical protein